MLKRLISLFLIVSTLLISIPLSVSADTTYTNTVTGFNMSRGENALIVYTYTYANYTGTNAYGYEVVVTDGVVSSVGGNNNYIPYSSTSFVVSGHGTAADWLQQNITVGMQASYNRYSYSVSFVENSNTYKYIVDQARDEAIAAQELATEACYVYDSDADVRFSAAEVTYNGTSAYTKESANVLAEEYKTIAALYREREIAEYRGVWVRPVQTSAAQVNSYVKKLYDGGINMINIETMYAGTMIMPMPSDSLFEQNPKFNGFDVLQAYINACHKYGMELHCWMPVFYSYSAIDTNGTSYMLSPGYKKPEWCLVTQNGTVNYTGESESQALVFLNPALDEVQDFLAESYEYILRNYDIDGFQLDYIRYRDRYGVDDYGYDDTTISLFKQAYPKYSYYNITYNTSAAYWNDWMSFRRSLVTKFVERMRTLINDVAPEVMLSADVGSSLDTAKSHIYQDSMAWMQDGLLDMIHPMAYSEGGWDYVEPYFDYVGDGCLVVPGLGAFVSDFDAEDMLRHTLEMSELGCEGVIYFESESFMNKECDNLLSSSVFTEKAVAPSYNDTDTALKVLERFKERINKASSAGYITSTLAVQLIDAVNGATGIAQSGVNYALNELISIRTSLSSVSSTSLKNRLLKDINIAIDAAYRDPGLENDNSTLADGTLPSDAVGAVQLTIDKVNEVITGEDSVLITDLDLSYTGGWENALLLKPVSGKTNVYTVVEVYNGVADKTSSDVIFDTVLTSGMLVAAFHSDGTGSGNARYELASTVAVGAEIGVFGVDVASGTQIYKNSMIYVLGTGNADVELGPGSFGEYKPFWLTHYEDDIVEGSGVAFLESTTTSWRLVVSLMPVGNTGVYEVVQIVNNIANGNGTTVTAPEGGFVYTLNKGNDYTSTGGHNFTSTGCNNAIADVSTWKVGDMYEINGLDFDMLEVPTSTPTLSWYDPDYVCTATCRKFTPGVSEDTSNDSSAENSSEESSNEESSNEESSTEESSNTDTSYEPVVIPENQLWLTHYNNNTAEGSGVIFTETYTRAGWWIHFAFTPIEGTSAYEITEISNGLAYGDATPLSIPENGFVYCLNYGNDYPSLGDNTQPDYTNDAVNEMISVALGWQIGDRFVFDGIDLVNKTVPTTTSDVNWYDDGYVCTATWSEYVPGQEPSEDSSDDTSSGGSEDDSNIDLGGYSRGDVNADGLVDIYDYVLIKRAYFGTYTLDAYQTRRADVDSSGDIDIYDYVLVKRAYFGTYTIK